jgi:hypothetical protein
MAKGNRTEEKQEFRIQGVKFSAADLLSACYGHAGL